MTGGRLLPFWALDLRLCFGGLILRQLYWEAGTLERLSSVEAIAGSIKICAQREEVSRSRLRGRVELTPTQKSCRTTTASFCVSGGSPRAVKLLLTPCDLVDGEDALPNRP